MWLKTAVCEIEHKLVKADRSQELPATSRLVFNSSEEDRAWLKECWYGEVFSIKDLLDGWRIILSQGGKEGSGVEGNEVLNSVNKGQPDSSESRSYVEDSYPGNNTSENIATVVQGDVRV
ncbi:hypothetical protein Ancab_035460 [Ancistrocladus abbreviatus]